jgi:hypothetical protein
MNALFLKDPAEKTHRGLCGRVENGKAGGGLCYGYRVEGTVNGPGRDHRRARDRTHRRCNCPTHLPGIHGWPLAEADREAPEPAAERELERVQNDIRRVMEAIKNGFAGPDLKAEWDALQERKTALQGKLDSADEPSPLLHPGMAELSRQKVADLAQAREHPPRRGPKPLKRFGASSTPSPSHLRTRSG